MDKVFQNNLSVLVRHYRTLANLTQTDLAQKLNLSLRTYQRIEMGDAMPSLETLISLSQFLNFKFSELFRFDDGLSQELRVLNRSTQFLEETARIAKVGSWELNVETQEFFWSEILRSILEVDANEVTTLEAAIGYIKSPAEQERTRNAVQESIQTGTPQELELVIVTARGVEKNVIVRGIADFIDDRCSRLYGTVQDVTQIKFQEEKLKHSLAELQEVQAFAGLGRWELNLQSNVLIWSNSLYELFEIDPTDFKATYEAFLDLVHPEDRERVDFAYSNSLVTKLPYEIEHRLLFKDGRIKWVLERCRTTFNEAGQPLLSSGYALDITRFRQPEPEARIPLAVNSLASSLQMN